MIYPKVGIIILNWNGWEDTIECLESLNQIDYQDYEVIIVDNDSKNDSIKKIKEYCNGDIKVESDFVKFNLENKPIKVIEYTKKESENVKTAKELMELPSNKKITLIKNDTNAGFPEGCNIGMRYALNQGMEYLLLLNNDTVVDNKFLKELVDVAETDPKIGILGSKIYYYNYPNILQAAGGRIRWNLGIISTYNGEDKGQYDEIKERDYVYGTSLLMKKSVIDNISFMDPTFFFGVEEYDYCNKAIKAGFKVVYVPGSMVWHKVGASSKNLSDYPETYEFIKKTAGRNYNKYLYKLFKRHGPRVFYVFSYEICVLSKRYVQVSFLAKRFFVLLSQGEKDTIKRFIKARF